MRTTLAILISIFTFFYLLPFSVALARGRTNTTAIFLLNLLLGWSLVGWILALVWAVAHDEVRANRQHA